jgi:protein TonB
MYGAVQHSGRRTRALGIVAATAMTAGFGYMFATGMDLDLTKPPPSVMEMLILTPPEPPPPVEEIKPVEVPEEIIEAAPAPPELVAPDIEFEIETPPVITAPVAPPVVVPDPAPVAPAPAVGAQRSAPKLRAGDKPAYPAAAQRAGEQGTTQLEVCVSKVGRVMSVSVLKSSGSSRLDDAAAKWIRGERFTPGSIGGVAQDMCGHKVFYQWNLKDA